MPALIVPTAPPDEAEGNATEGNATAIGVPHVCVHELFERQVARDPDAVALIFGGQALSYRELNARANQVGRTLRQRGVGPESLVGVCLVRSPEMVIALLGVWKAGAAYVPLDPDYPPDRLAFMVRDARLRLLLTDSQSLPLFATDTVEAICLDTDWPIIAREKAGNLAPTAIPSNLAYVMYTSGSTGEPKGAMIVHSGLVNYLCWAIDAYEFEAGCAVPLHSSIAFDLTVTSLYPPLLVGGQVELLPEDWGGQSLLAALRQGKRHSLVKITPAHLDLLSQQLDPAEMAQTSKAFVIGGENLLAESLLAWRQYAPDTRLFNEYGPTETVVGCCVYEVQPGDSNSGSVPIGRPIANTRLYVLDEDQRIVPSGVAGELYIGGAGVARGYLHRPELTRERFLADPFSDDPAARIYRTGDLARYREDGILEYLGRTDNQVKVRGYRIELGEIEARLAAHSGVRACAVLAREDESGKGLPGHGQRQLVAYVVRRDEARLVSNEMQSFLKQRLPSYMVPAQFVILDALPLTRNGKVDRNALPAPSADLLAAADRFVLPRTDVERTLAAIWKEVLKVENIGIDDDFFDLGGQSLTAILAVSRIREAFAIDLETQALFANPTLAALAEVVIALTEAAGAHHDVQRIERRPGAGSCALSFAQEQIWFFDRLAPASPAYNIVDVIRVSGTYDADAMERALNELVMRHEILRTEFRDRNGQAVQVILPRLDILDAGLSECDLSLQPDDEQEQAWIRLVHEQGRQPFVLSEAPLFRATMIHMSSQEHRLLLTIHHIIADEWSMELIQQEVHDLYEAFSQGRPSPLSPLPIQYADFACWQRKALQGQSRQKQLAYWKDELADAPAMLELPIDKPRPAVQSFRGATQVFELPPPVVARLNALARQEQATLFMVLEASFMAFLHRYTGQDDILVGIPITGRTQPGTERLIGYFLNTLVLRARFSDRMSFRALLQQVRQRALGAYAHPDIPFNQLVAELTPERVPGQTPLFQTMFVLHDIDGVSQVSTVAGNHELGTGTAKFDLSMVLSQSDGRLDGLIEYSTDLFEDRTIRRMCGHYLTLLEGIAGNPEQAVSRLPLLSELERQVLREDWNHIAVLPGGSDRCLHELIEAQASRTPHRVAVAFGSQTLTYGELNRRANQLARYLRDLGVGPEVPVGIFMERSPEMVIGLLAILKAGGAYVPLDPSYPEQRLAGIMEDAAATVLLTEETLKGRLLGQKARLLSIDGLREEIACCDDGPLPAQGTPDNLAYVIFTSGSTGRPKGVAVTHRALVNLLESMGNAPGLDETDVLLSVTTLSFDIAALELYLPLIKGARVTLVSRDESLDGRRLMARLVASGATVMQATPATWRLLIDAGWEGTSGLKGANGHKRHSSPFLPLQGGGQVGDGGERHGIQTHPHPSPPLAPVRVSPSKGEGVATAPAYDQHFQTHPGLKVLCGGEALSRDLADKLLQRADEVWNLYGPTETTVWSAAERVETGDGPISIGRPIANTQLWVLDRHLEPLPVGVAGELCIGGIGVARGYWKRPELTAERFVPDLLSGARSARLYRTGDWAKWLPDGRLECLGRMDHQLKIRGFRIEPGEIEAALVRHPAVRAAVVVARDDNAGEKRLVAYLVAENPPADLIEQLRQQVRATLPDYMLPASFVLLDALPLTHNGKIDRKALPAPATMETGARAAHQVGPRTPSETLVLDIFQDLLGRTDFGVLDSFFDLGGHSILAARAVLRIHEASGIDLPLRNLFERPTAAGLAGIVDELAWLKQVLSRSVGEREEIEL